MKTVLFLIALVLAGCAIPSKPYTPDGQPGYVVNGSGAALNWGACYEKAGDLCGAKGYTTLDCSGDSGQLAGFTGGTLDSMPTMSRTLLIRCNGEAGAPA